jgi:hypothetical protein
VPRPSTFPPVSSRKIRSEIFSDDWDDKHLWDFLEQLAAELLMLRNQVEGEVGETALGTLSHRSQ